MYIMFQVDEECINADRDLEMYSNKYIKHRTVLVRHIFKVEHIFKDRLV